MARRWLDGTLLSPLSPQVQSRCALFGNVAGLALILFSAAVSSRDEPVWDKPGWFYVAVLFSPCCGNAPRYQQVLACSRDLKTWSGPALPERPALASHTLQH